MGLLICKYERFLTISQCRVSDTQVTIKAYGPLGFSNFSTSGIDFLGGDVTNCPWLVHKNLDISVKPTYDFMFRFHFNMNV